MAVVETFIGWLAPPVCIGCGIEGDSICVVCSMSGVIPFGERCFGCSAMSQRSGTCDKCRNSGAPRHVWVCTDYDGIVKQLVQKYKFDHQRVASASIARLMADTFMAYNSDEDIRKADYIIVPIPTATSRVRERSFDHSKLLAKKLARTLSVEYKNPIMRIGQSRQVGLSRSDRIKKAAGKYVVRRPGDIKDRNVLLIDDVVTTGATLSSAAKALRAAGAHRVDALVFAKRL